MSTLLWPIKASLIAYVGGMDDGSVEVSDGAGTEGDGFSFAATSGDELRFQGTVALTAHGGMLRLVFRDPALVHAAGGWTLTIADPDDPHARLPFARFDDLIDTADGRRAVGGALTADGADLFFGPYEAGTPVDAALVRG